MGLLNHLAESQTFFYLFYSLWFVKLILDAHWWLLEIEFAEYGKVLFEWYHLAPPLVFGMECCC